MIANASALSPQTIVVIGNGMVGHRFVEAAVELGIGPIVVVGEEWRRAYDRVHLSAVFDGTTGVLRPDSPQFSSPMGVWSFASIPQGLLVGGDFAWAVNSNNVRQGLVLFNGTP